MASMIFMTNIASQSKARKQTTDGKQFRGRIPQDGFAGQNGFRAIVNVGFQLSLQGVGATESHKAAIAETVGIAVVLAEHIVGRSVRHIFHQADPASKTDS